MSYFISHISMVRFPISQNNQLLRKWRDSLNNDVLKSPCTPTPIPEDTIIERILRSLRAHAEKHPHKASVIEAHDQARSLTYLQIRDRALAFATFLTTRGFTLGDRVTVALPNSIEWPVVHLGTWAAGGSVVGARVAFKLEETIHQLRDSGSTVVVVSEESLGIVIDATRQCQAVKIIICVRSSDKHLPEGVIDFELTLKNEPLRTIAPVTLDSECIVYYSSGTTGLPKGVVHTHKSFHCLVELMCSHWDHEIYPVLLNGEPIDWYEEPQVFAFACYHISGFQALNWFLITGSPIVLMRTFDGDVYLEAIDKFKPRFLGVSPPLFAYLAKDPSGKNSALSSVQMIMCGAAPLSKELSDEFQASHPNIKYIVQAYGMTETGTCHVPLLLEEGVNAAGGVLASFYEQKIIDPITQVVCKQGQQGEVWLRGAAQTVGYLNNPQATKELIDKDGWLHSGDIGFIDERGLLHIVDRLKEMIKVDYKTQTLQVAPAQIEGILLTHPKIRDAAVAGVIIEQKPGELIRAFVVRVDNTLTCEGVEKLVAEKLAAYQHITGGVYFVDAIPRAATGKILRRALNDVIIA